MEKLIEAKEKTTFILIPSDTMGDMSCVLINAGEEFINDIEKCFDASSLLQELGENHMIDVHDRNYMTWLPDHLFDFISIHESEEKEDNAYYKFIDMTTDEFEKFKDINLSYCHTIYSNLKFWGDYTLSFSVRVKEEGNSEIRYFDTELINMSEFY